MLSIITATMLAIGLGQGFSGSAPADGVSASAPLSLSGGTLSCPLCLAPPAGKMQFDANGKLIFLSSGGFSAGPAYGDIKLAGGAIFGTGAEGDNVLGLTNAAASSGKIGYVWDTLNTLPGGAHHTEWFNNGSLLAILDPNGNFSLAGNLIPLNGSVDLGSSSATLHNLWLTSGRNICFDSSCNVNLSGNGTSIANLTGALVATSSIQGTLMNTTATSGYELNGNPTLFCISGNCAANGVAVASNSGTPLKLAPGGAATSVTFPPNGGTQPAAQTLDTCASALEGLIERDVLGGASTGHRTRLCLCRSDGAGAYAWQNLAGTSLTDIGTSTTCPD